MAPNTRSKKISTTSNPPVNTLPAVMDGIVDIKVLSKIHSCLIESSQDEDLALAAYVKENFLYEPSNIESRDVRTAEGFFNLERAWRRVRALTGKAVDKWPFFYSSWKKMTAPVVRKNAQGAYTSGVSVPATAKAPRDSAPPTSLPPVKKEPKGDSALPTIAETVEETMVETAIKAASGDTPSEEQPAKPVRGYEPPWTEPPVMKTSLDKLPKGCTLAKKRKAEAAVEEGPRPKRGRKEASKTPAPEAAPKMTTRRSARAKAA